MNELITEGFIEEKPTKLGNKYALTTEGAEQIAFLTFPSYLFQLLLMVAGADILLGIEVWILRSIALPVAAVGFTGMGVILFGSSVALYSRRHRMADLFFSNQSTEQE